MFDPRNPMASVPPGTMQAMGNAPHFGGGPVMQPGGGTTGAPLPGTPAPGGPPAPGTQPGWLGGGGGHQMPNVNALMQTMQDWQGQMKDWRQSRPDHFGFTGSPQDWRGAIQDWRGQRPDMPDFRNALYGAPVAGNTGVVPPNMLPPTTVGMVPGVPGSMGTNPGAGGVGTSLGVIGATPPPSPFQLPGY